MRVAGKFKRFLLLLCGLLGLLPVARGQTYTLSGRVIDEQSRQPLELATLYVLETEQWAATDQAGTFTLRQVPRGRISLRAQILGYAPATLQLDVQADQKRLVIALKPQSLKLAEVTVSAELSATDPATTYRIDRAALDHAQVLNVSSLTALLPGGKMVGDQNLASNDDRLLIHSHTSEMGNAAFGTVVDVDGVRLSNNAAMDETSGTSLRNLSSASIESVEIVTGIPSVEYGDLSGGIVKVNTRRGQAPLTVELSTEPKTKHVAVSKGLLLGDRAGTLNASLERTRSTSNLASPHTAYTRNGLTLSYANTLLRSTSRPLMLTAGFTGNLGGYNSEADPDAFQETYTKKRDYALRGHVKLDWMASRPWLTRLTLQASASYADRLTKVNTNKSSASTQPYIHATEEGYHIAEDYDTNPDADIILSPTGYWYQLALTDSRPLDLAAKLKAQWAHRWSGWQNQLMVGAEWSGSANRGRGLYYDDMRYAPTWREYRYDDLPMMHNVALYIEEKLDVPLNKVSSLQLSAGLRHDITHISQSAYGTAQSLSPRFNAKLTLWQKQANQWVTDLNLSGGWGRAVKLPSFEVLYPEPTYADKLAFAPGSTADGTSYYAYYTSPTTPVYNPDLKWQYTQQGEIGLEARVLGTRITVSYYRNKTYRPYYRTNTYTPYTYKLTTQSSLEDCEIPSANRQYTIDRTTGIVTVTDITGTYASQELAYTERNTFKTVTLYSNASPTLRQGIDWIVDFTPISAIGTKIRLDGSYYYYRGLNEKIIADMPSSASTMADGNPYKYVGYYIGSNTTSTSTAASSSAANGKLSKRVDVNLTVTTHIPKIRLIVSLRLEGSLLRYDKNLCEYSGGTRGIALDSSSDYFSDDTDIYGRDKYVAVYPLYYSTWEDPDTRINFAEQFEWARDNDTTLYNELAKLVAKSNTSYYFNPNRLSSYITANLNITKEIGDRASISFYATNFFNHTGRVRSSQTDLESSLYGSSYIPGFYYGLALRLKL